MIIISKINNQIHVQFIVEKNGDRFSLQSLYDFGYSYTDRDFAIENEDLNFYKNTISKMIQNKKYAILNSKSKHKILNTISKYILQNKHIILLMH